MSFWYITARVTLKVGKGVEGDDEAWLAFLLVSNCEDRILLYVKMNSSSLQVDNTFQEMGIIGHWKVNQFNYNHKQDSSYTICLSFTWHEVFFDSDICLVFCRFYPTTNDVRRLKCPLLGQSQKAAFGCIVTKSPFTEKEDQNRYFDRNCILE